MTKNNQIAQLKQPKTTQKKAKIYLLIAIIYIMFVMANTIFFINVLQNENAQLKIERLNTQSTTQLTNEKIVFTQTANTQPTTQNKIEISSIFNELNKNLKALTENTQSINTQQITQTANTQQSKTAQLFNQSLITQTVRADAKNKMECNPLKATQKTVNSITQNEIITTEYHYAQIQNSNVYLYSEPFGTPLFELPQTFYVKLTENSKNGHYKAEYMNVSGYVLESDVQCVANEPTTPYLTNVSFRNYGTQSSELRTEPSRLAGTNTLICELPLYETNFTYYGKISGEEVVPNRGDIWYYCKYTKNNQSRFGYIYAGLIDLMTNYLNNPLDAYPILKHEWKSTQTETTNPNIALPDQKQTLIILGISIPIIVILALMFKPIQNKNERNRNLNNTNKRHKNADNNIDNNNINKRRPTFEQPRYANSYNLNNTPPPKQHYFKQTRKTKKVKDYYEL
ncbi:MAG: hypothetical protein ACI4TX_04160 [Christensenellales bacterium]